MRAYLSHAPAVVRMLDARRSEARWEQREANLAELTNARWRWRLVQLAVPVVCLLGYLLWNGSGIHREAIRELILPVTTKDWLVILPYALLVPVLLGRDHIQQRHLERQIKQPRRDRRGVSENAPDPGARRESSIARSGVFEIAAPTIDGAPPRRSPSCPCFRTRSPSSPERAPVSEKPRQSSSPEGAKVVLAARRSTELGRSPAEISERRRSGGRARG